MLKPQRLGNLSLPDMELTEDKRHAENLDHVVLVRGHLSEQFLHRKKILCSDEVGEAYFQKNCDE